jgi:long-chain acyl-CoA synthetase
MIKNIKNKSLLNLNASISISDILEKNSKNFEKKIFLIDHTSKKIKNITYFEFNNYVNYCCGYFKNLGLIKRDIISLILDNSVAYLILYFASIRYGTILNPLPPTLGKSIIEEKLADVNPKIIFTNLNHELKKNKRKIHNIDTDDIEKFIRLITKKSSKKITKYKAKKKDTALLYYSSGTTGKSKIIEYSNLAILENQKALINSKLVCKNNIHLSFLPLYHTASLRYSIKFNLCVGGTVVLFKNFWSLKDDIWKIINKYKINYFQAVPTILNVIVNSNFKKYKKPKSIDYIGSGSSILPGKLLKNFQSKFNIKISNLYGLSEIGCSHFDNPFLKKKKLGTIGKILPGFKYKIFINKDLSTNTKKIGEFGVKSQT